MPPRLTRGCHSSQSLFVNRFAKSSFASWLVELPGFKNLACRSVVRFAEPVSVTGENNTVCIPAPPPYKSEALRARVGFLNVKKGDQYYWSSFFVYIAPKYDRSELHHLLRLYKLGGAGDPAALAWLGPSFPGSTSTILFQT